MVGPLLPAFSKLSALLHTRETDHRMDHLVFRLHHRVTTRLLLLFAFVVSTRSLAGEPIECTTDARVPRQVMNTFCFVTATFSVAGDPAMPDETPAGLGTGGAPRRHAFYQWVPFVLCLQALLFFLPYAAWKHCSGSVMRDCFAFQLDLPDTTLHGSSTKLSSFAGYLSARMGRVNQGLVRAFFVAELACLVNVVGNVFLLDAFLGGGFGAYSVGRLAEVLRLPGPAAADTVFPSLAKCTFLRFGYSGTIERIDAVCVLPHNVFNEKMFVLLWLWTALLAALTGLHALYRVASLAVPKVRRNILLSLLLDEFQEEGRQVFEQCTVYDWFLLCNIAKHMDTLAFSELMRHLTASYHDLLLPGVVSGSRRASEWSDSHRKFADRRVSSDHIKLPV